MDVKERLSLEDVSAHSLMALEHLHRYELAAPVATGLRVLDLCCGVGYGSRILAGTAASVLGVDRDAGAIDTATAASADVQGVRFVAADALRHLQRTESGDLDLIVCFEGLEHVADLEGVVKELERLVAGGAALLASMPNSQAYQEDNPHHLTDFGLESARAMADRFPGATLAFQVHAEGSLIRTETSEELVPHLALPDGMDVDYANHFVLAVGIDVDRLFGSADARMHLTVTPFMHRYKRGLEHAVADLRATNARLGRERLGIGDAAAGARTATLESYIDWERAENDRLRDLLGRTAAERDRLRTELEGIHAAAPGADPVLHERDALVAELDALARERDELRRVAGIARGSRLVRAAARLAGHDVHADPNDAPPVGADRWRVRLRGRSRRR